jgi:hypothetical protein
MTNIPFCFYGQTYTRRNKGSILKRRLYFSHPRTRGDPFIVYTTTAWYREERGYCTLLHRIKRRRMALEEEEMKDVWGVQKRRGRWN